MGSTPELKKLVKVFYCLFFISFKILIKSVIIASLSKYPKIFWTLGKSNCWLSLFDNNALSKKMHLSNYLLKVYILVLNHLPYFSFPSLKSFSDNQKAHHLILDRSDLAHLDIIVTRIFYFSCAKYKAIIWWFFKYF